MKQKLKALASLCLALALTLCLTLPAWAAGGDDAAGQRITQETKGSISLSWETDDTDTVTSVTAYKVIQVDYQYPTGDDNYEAPKDPEFFWVNEVAAWVRKNYPAYIGTDNSVQDDFADANDAAIKDFFDVLAANVEELKLAGTPMDVEDSTASLDTGMGGYLILVAGGTKIYSPVFVSLEAVYKNGFWEIENKNVNVKAENLTINKYVKETDDGIKTEKAKAGISDTVYFVLEADVPSYPNNAANKTYAISDILPSGMTLSNSSIAVEGCKDDGTDDVLNNTPENQIWTQDTQRPVTDTDQTTFTLHFVYDKIKSYDKIRVTYSAELNNQAQTGPSGNMNKAYLDYSRDPHAETDFLLTAEDTTTTFTYGIQVTKKGESSGEGQEEPFLTDAVFTLKKADTNEPEISFVNTGDGSYRVADSTETGATELTVGTNGSMKGVLKLSGLDVGEYLLTEVQAPAGYNKLSAPISITIEDEDDGVDNSNAGPNGKPEYTDSENNTEVEAADGYVPVTVTNTKGFTLPTTGGMGTVLFTAGGVVLMGAGLVLLVVFLRRRAK